MKSWNFDSTTGDVRSDGTVLCKVYGATTYNRSINATKCMRTARLIAAAPEMYELLNYFTLTLDVGNEEFYEFARKVNEARDLLARIDGEETTA